MPRIVNLPLLAHPMNWIIVNAVLLLVGFAFTVIMDSRADCGCQDGGVPD